MFENFHVIRFFDSLLLIGEAIKAFRIPLLIHLKYLVREKNGELRIENGYFIYRVGEDTLEIDSNVDSFNEICLVFEMISCYNKKVEITLEEKKYKFIYYQNDDFKNSLKKVFLSYKIDDINDILLQLGASHPDKYFKEDASYIFYDKKKLYAIKSEESGIGQNTEATAKRSFYENDTHLNIPLCGVHFYAFHSSLLKYKK